MCGCGSPLFHPTSLSLYLPMPCPVYGFSQKEIVNTNLESMRSAIDHKRKNLETIVVVMRRKVGDIQTRRAEFKGAAEESAAGRA